MTGRFCISFDALVSALLAKPCSCEAIQSESLVTGITTDTRQVKLGDLFVALEGETFNGHDFVAEAIAKGAIAAIVREGVFPAESVLPRLETACGPLLA